MSFLVCQKEIPDFLTFYLKYTRFIGGAADTTTEESFNDLKTYFRYLKLSKDNVEITREKLKETPINDMTPEDFQNVSKQDIDKFLYFLKYDLDNSPKTRNRKLATLKKFFEYMYNNNYITNNPTKFMKSATVEKRLPKYLNLDESKTLLSKTAKTEDRNKIRNYAIVCMFLNCCLRLSELVEINLTDIKLDDKTLKINGKGNKERITYLDDAVIEAIKNYLEIRPKLDKTDINHNALFLSERKKRISRRNVQVIIENELKKAFQENKTNLHTHSLRHTGATLLYNECDISILIIQKILGHKQLSSTEIYTHVSNKKLKEVMKNCAISSLIERMEELNNGKIQ